MPNLTKLFEPINIGTLDVRNRIVMPPMVTNYGSDTGAVSQRLIDYHVERAKGGVGLGIVEATCVDSPVGRLSPTQLCIDSDKFIPRLNDLAEAVQVYGARIAIQLHHSGRQTTLVATEGRRPVSPSTVPCPPLGTRPRRLTVKEIESLVEKYAEGARRAKAAGFDAVELHGAHGYLIQQFLSPYTNKRRDRYGGDPQRRITFAIDVVESVREKVGSSFPVIMRLSGNEYVEGGLTIEDTKIIARELEEAGVDAIHMSAGLRESYAWSVQPMAVPRGCLVHLAEETKKAVSIPVIAVGRINDPALAETIIREGKADLVSMGRALIADPELPRKASEGRLDDIRVCVACNQCVMRMGLCLPVSCTVNAAAGRERERKISPTKATKRVLVIGGGPAGMEAARVAALRGHTVTLIEREERLGGQLVLAATPPHKEELENEIKYLVSHIKKLGVKIELGKEATIRTVEEMKPDTVILATGAAPLIPIIPGVDRKSVVTAWDVLKGKVTVGKNVVVAGGGMVGLETAEFLAAKGISVIVVEMLSHVGIDMESRSRYLLLQRLVKCRVEILTGVRVEEITESGVSVTNEKGNRQHLPAETVVLALGAIPIRELADSLKGKVRELYIVGDCLKPRKAMEAIHGGFYVACEL